jgi:NADH-quinone oxidoreductase subunit K
MGASVWEYQLIAGALFMLGVLGVLIRRNLIVIFMSIELMLNAANLSLVGFSRLHGNLDGQVFAFMVIVVAAVEVAVGLAILISVMRNRDTINIEDTSLLKW